MSIVFETDKVNGKDIMHSDLSASKPNFQPTAALPAPTERAQSYHTSSLPTGDQIIASKNSDSQPL